METQTLLAPSENTTHNKWRNLAFTKDGKTYRGVVLHDTQKSAMQAIRDLEKEINDPDYGFPVFALAGWFFSKDYSHAVSMPV